MTPQLDPCWEVDDDAAVDQAMEDSHDAGQDAWLDRQDGDE